MSDDGPDIKLAEKIIVMLNHGEGLLFDFATLSQRTPLVLTPKYKRITDTAIKNFPNKPEKLHRIKDYEELVTFKMSSLFDEIIPYYEAYDGLREWFENVAAVLKSGTSYVATTGLAGGEVSRNYMKLLVVVTKLCFIRGRFADMRVVFTYYRLGAKHLGKKIVGLQENIEFFSKHEDFLGLMRKRLLGIHTAVGKMIAEYGQLWSQTEQDAKELKLRTWNALEIFGQPQRIEQRAKCVDYMKFFLRDHIAEAILLTVLVVPEALCYPVDPKPLGAKQAKNVGRKNSTQGALYLSMVLRYYWNCTILGSQTIDIQSQIDLLFKKYKSPYGVKMSNLKRPIEKMVPGRCKTAHDMRKLFLHTQLKNCYHVCTDSPELLGPKFIMIYSLLSLARSEVKWELAHLNHPKVYNPKKDGFGKKMSHIRGIIYYCDWIFRIVLHNERKISAFHRKLFKEDEKFTEFDREKLEKKKISEEALDNFEYVLTEYKEAYNLFGARLTWQRIAVRTIYQYHLSEMDSKEFLKNGDELSMVSKHIDQVRTMMIEASQKQLYFHEEVYNKMYKMSLKNGVVYCISLIRLWDIFRECAPIVKKETRKKIGFESTMPAERMLNELVERILALIQSIKGKNGIGILFKRIKDDKTNAWMKYGEESHFKNSNHVQSLIDIQELLYRGLGEINANRKVQIYDTVFHPLEFLKLGISRVVENFIDGLVKINTDETIRGSMTPPTRIVTRINVYVAVLHMISQFININVKELVLSAMVNKFVHVEEKSRGEKTVHKSVIGYLARFYVNTLDNWQKNFLLYHPIKGTFVNTEKTIKSKSINFLVEHYMDQNELAALVTLIGPFGMENIEKRLLDKIYEVSDNVRKEVLKSMVVLSGKKEMENKKLLVKFENKIYDDDLFTFIPKWPKVTAFPKMDQFFDYLLDLGVFIQFRKNLHSALKRSMQTWAPQIYSVVHDVKDQVNDNIRKMKGFRKVNKLAADAGIFDEDRSLKFRLKDISKDKSWNVLPVAFGALLTSSRWKDCMYDTNLEGWRNNTHLIIEVFNELFVNLFPEHKLKEMGKRFSEVAGLVLLNMRTQKVFEKQKENCYVFVDKLYSSCPFLYISDFERVNPHVLTRYAYFSFFN